MWASGNFPKATYKKVIPLEGDVAENAPVNKAHAEAIVNRFIRYLPQKTT